MSSLSSRTNTTYGHTRIRTHFLALTPRSLVVFFFWPDAAPHVLLFSLFVPLLTTPITTTVTTWPAAFIASVFVSSARF